MPASHLQQHVRVAPLRRNIPAEPVPVDVQVRACRAADLASRVGAAARSLASATVAGRLGLARLGGAGHKAPGLNDERGDGLSGLVCDLGEHRRIGVGCEDDAGVAKHVLDDLQVRSGGQRERGRAVPQVM